MRFDFDKWAESSKITSHPDIRDITRAGYILFSGKRFNSKIKQHANTIFECYQENKSEYSYIDQGDIHNTIACYRGMYNEVPVLQSSENTLQQRQSKDRGMKCVLGIHQWNKCVCARCDETRYKKRPDISVHSAPSKLKAIMQQHDWHGCTCSLCGVQHIYVHYESEYLNKRVSLTDGLYRQRFRCAICGQEYARDAAGEDTIL